MGKRCYYVNSGDIVRNQYRDKIFLDRLYGDLEFFKIQVKDDDEKEALTDFMNSLSRPLSMVVLGAAGSGRSTFINALLGKQLLRPEFYGFVNEIKYGMRESVAINYDDGDYEECSADECVQLLKVQADAGKQVASVEWFFPSDVLQNVNFIDCLGVSSESGIGSSVARFVNDADVAVWMFSALQDDFSREIAALRELPSRLKVIAVLNKVDLAEAEGKDVDAIFDGLKSALEDRILGIVGVSAQVALEGVLENDASKMEAGCLDAFRKVVDRGVYPNADRYKLLTFLEQFSFWNGHSFKGNELDDNFKANLELVTEKIHEYLQENELDAGQCAFFRGVLSYYGIGCNADVGKGIDYFYKAVDARVFFANIVLLRIMRKSNNSNELFALLVKFARYGFVTAYDVLLGRFYTGEFGDDFLDEAEAFKCFKRAYDNGIYEAAYFLGICYQEGFGVAADEAVAFTIFAKDALRGNAGSQFQLGDCYFNGSGTDKDLVNAKRWLLESANNGYSDAQYALGCFYKYGHDGKQNLDLAYQWLVKAYENGDMDAKTELDEILARFN